MYELGATIGLFYCWLDDASSGASFQFKRIKRLVHWQWYKTKVNYFGNYFN